MKIRLNLNFTNLCGALALGISCYAMFWQGCVVGGILILGRAGIELAEKALEVWGKKAV